MTPSGRTAETRWLPLRRREDLVCREQEFQGVRYWHVKDPVALRYFQLRPEEFFVLQLLDGSVSLQDIRRKFERAFAPQTLPVAQVQAYLTTLHSAGLLVSSTGGQGEVLYQRSAQDRSRRIWQALSSLLAVRFRGLDPDRFLGWLEPRLRFVFRPVFVVFALSVIGSALLLAILNAGTLRARLPEFAEFFSPASLLWLALVLGTTKVLHELGHGVACRHFGARCHELGLMLLVLTPCLYCNVSDAWMLPNRWHRVLIGAAGMCVELFLAAIAFLLWWFSEPGLFNSICLNVVIVCSTTTLIFNGNPLLRYDGYYILSDLVEIPNLRQQAGTLVGHALCEFFCGTGLPDQRLLPDRSRVFLSLWYVASLAYRLLVLWGILWFLDRALSPLGLEVVSHVLALMAGSGLIVGPGIAMVRLFRSPFWSRTVDWSRFVVRSTVAALLIGAALLVPLPHSVKAPAIIETAGATSVYVSRAGRLMQNVKTGDTVRAGDVLARLENPELERETVRLENEIRLLTVQLDNLKKRRLRDSTVESLIPVTEERLSERQEQLRERQADVEKLTLRAPVAGVVLPPPYRGPTTAALSLPGWNGTPLDPQNSGSFLETGTEFCLIGDPQQHEALLAVDETDVEFVRAGQTVKLLIDHAASYRLTGTVLNVAEIDLDVARRELIEHEDFPTTVDERGVPRPVATAYQARVTLQPAEALLIQYGSGRARIRTEPLSLGARLLRFARRTFRFR